MKAVEVVPGVVTFVSESNLADELYERDRLTFPVDPESGASPADAGVCFPEKHDCCSIKQEI